MKYVCLQYINPALMKTILKLIFPGIIICLAWNYPSYNNVKDRSGNKEWVMNATKKYSPDSWDLLMQYESLPAKQEAEAVNGGIATTRKSTSTFNYLKGRSRIDLLSSMATNVHEIAHAYCNQNSFRHAREKGIKLNIEKAEEFLYYSPARSFFISFPLQSLFPSGELIPEISQNLRTFRFEPYIDGNTSTQEEGIVGLLNELHSYYLESKYCFEMLEAYKIAEELYKTQQAGQQENPGQEQNTNQDNANKDKSKSNVEDADYEVVDDDDKKK